MTCQVWIMDKQCGKKAVATWITTNIHINQAAEILVCKEHYDMIKSQKLQEL